MTRRTWWLGVGVLVSVFFSSPSAEAKDHAWQRGVLRDLQLATQAGAAISLPVGGTPPVTTGSVAVPGVAPTYLSIPIADELQYVTIDGPSALRYYRSMRTPIHESHHQRPIEFAVEGQRVYVKGIKGGQVHELELVSTTRLEK